jgi:hypothetical protein
VKVYAKKVHTDHWSRARKLKPVAATDFDREGFLGHVLGLFERIDRGEKILIERGPRGYRVILCEEF